MALTLLYTRAAKIARREVGMVMAVEARNRSRKAGGNKEKSGETFEELHVC